MGERLNGKTVIVTGSSSGIGKATALQMAREDADGRAAFVQADVSRDADHLLPGL